MAKAAEGQKVSEALPSSWRNESEGGALTGILQVDIVEALAAKGVVENIWCARSLLISNDPPGRATPL